MSYQSVEREAIAAVVATQQKDRMLDEEGFSVIKSQNGPAILFPSFSLSLLYTDGITGAGAAVYQRVRTHRRHKRAPLCLLLLVCVCVWLLVTPDAQLLLFTDVVFRFLHSRCSIFLHPLSLIA